MHMTMSLSRRPSRSPLNAWLSAPAFLWVLPTVVYTSAPCARASGSVASVELSATTMTRFGAGSWAPSESSVAPMEAPSLWAGMRTVTVTGPAKTPRVSAIASLGASNFTSVSVWEVTFTLMVFSPCVR